MRPMRFVSSHFAAVATIVLVLVFVQPAWGAAKYKVLYSFKGGTDGIYPAGALVFDGNGNLYGTTYAGGSTSNCFGDYYGPGCGIAFHLAPEQNGRWKESILHAFQNGSDGAIPNGSLLFDAVGSLYGSTLEGGTAHADNCGTIFSLTPGSGGWTENVIYTFCSQGGDGYFPGSGLIADQAGRAGGLLPRAANGLCRRWPRGPV